jgi:hypothetical protein
MRGYWVAVIAASLAMWSPNLLLAQDQLQLVPLATYVNQPIENDPAAVAYVFTRCSALFSVYALKLEPDTDPERQRVRKLMIANAENFMGSATQLNMVGSKLEVKDAIAMTKKQVVGLGQIYFNRIEYQKLLTSNMFDDKLIAGDFDICKTLAAKGFN